MFSQNFLENSCKYVVGKKKKQLSFSSSVHVFFVVTNE